MGKIKKSEKRFNEKERKLKLIRDFGKSMDYEIIEYEYDNCRNNRPCYAIELGGTSDIEGNPYSWAWYRDTWEEMR